MKSKRPVAFSVALALLVSICIVALTPVASIAVSDSWVRIAEDGLGNPKTGLMIPTVEFRDKMYFYVPYMSGPGPAVGAPLWTYDGLDFEKAPVADGFGDSNNSGVSPTVVYQGYLYCGTANYDPSGGAQLWRSPDGIDWEKIGTGVFTDPDDVECRPIGVQDGKLLVGFINQKDGARVWSYDGTSFSRVNDDGFGYGAKQMAYGAVFDDEVHVIAWDRDNGGPLLPMVYKGGTKWEATAEPGFGDNNNIASFMAAADESGLFVGTVNPSGGEVWSYDGSSWSQVGDAGIDDPRNTAVFASRLSGALYVGATVMEDEPFKGPSRLFRLKSDGSFEQLGREGFGDENNTAIIPATSYKGYLMASAQNNSQGAQVWAAPVPPPDTYYFAEGTTRNNPVDGSFEEWICIQNPNQGKTTATVIYMFAGGSGAGTIEKVYEVPADSRLTVNVAADVGADKDVSVEVVGGDPLVVERPMYFNYKNKWSGGHVVMGVPIPRKTWYFAEGTTRNNPVDGSFEEWICIQNPNETAASADITYMLGDGSVQTGAIDVPANGRCTVDVNKEVGADKDVSVRVESDIPIVSERPIYFDYHCAWDGGHDTVGAPGTSTEFYFAEGCTHPWAQEWICIQNPNREEAEVTLFYQIAGEEQLSETIRVPPTSRSTVDVVGAVGEGKDVSVYLISELPVVAERPTYFNYQEKWPGGHIVMGLDAPKLRFYFAEGTTRQNPADGYFDEWICIQNPNPDIDADVEITFMSSEGLLPVEKRTVEASSRATLSVNQLLGPDVDASIYVESDTEVVVERPQYFLYHGIWPGGSDTIGQSY